jgi:predicted 3-demethylubiquinone-9 3-methyltransferase (glyoxalase superfamily)
MQKITPCLWFDTEAEEAATFYTSVFADSRIVEVARYGDAGPRAAGSVMTVLFELQGERFVALNGGPQFRFNESVSFQVDCADQAEVDHYWSCLSEGGEESMCGWLKDRFGVSWQVVPAPATALLSDPDPERARRATAALLEMRRIDIAAVQRAADGG